MPNVVNEESSVELPRLDEGDQPFPSIADLLLEMDKDWDALSDWKPPMISDSYGLADEISAELLPQDCTGWGRYDTNSIVCALCDYNVDCMTAGDERQPSRDQ